MKQFEVGKEYEANDPGYIQIRDETCGELKSKPPFTGWFLCA